MKLKGDLPLKSETDKQTGILLVFRNAFVAFKEYKRGELRTRSDSIHYNWILGGQLILISPKNLEFTKEVKK